MDSASVSASQIAAKLNLNSHPEGGFYSETFRDSSIILHTSQLPSQFLILGSLQTRLIVLLVPPFTSCYLPGVYHTFIAYHAQKPGIFIWVNLLHHYCDVLVAIALSDMHECESKKNVKRFKGEITSQNVKDLSFQDQPRSPFRFFMYAMFFLVVTIILIKLQRISGEDLDQTVVAAIEQQSSILNPRNRPVMELNDKDGTVKLTCIGSNPMVENQHLQYTVPPYIWFGAFPTKDIDIDSVSGAAVKTPPRDGEKHFSLVGCTCAPAFQFEDFELAKRSELVSHFPKYESLIKLLTYAE
ncbi:hypothetical protein HYC85_003686 [Camellia sinensis]|uniref:DUF985 domain-containing protein n=1 Tax=Camellia sinensis TaxID=4442 RepID=A0A7J7HW46_CAMSI|nr:hypothetical protein HYC85_003686 [Camellia sinensis]